MLLKTALYLLYFIITAALWISGGFLIGGSMACSSIAGPMNIDLSFINSLLGLLLLFCALFLTFRKRDFLLPKIYGMMLYSFLLFFFGLYVRHQSNADLMSRISFDDMIAGPNQISLAVFYSCTFILFSVGVLTLANSLERLITK